MFMIFKTEIFELYQFLLYNVLISVLGSSFLFPPSVLIYDILLTRLADPALSCIGNLLPMTFTTSSRASFLKVFSISLGRLHHPVSILSLTGPLVQSFTFSEVLSLFSFHLKMKMPSFRSASRYLKPVNGIKSFPKDSALL